MIELLVWVLISTAGTHPYFTSKAKCEEAAKLEAGARCELTTLVLPLTR